MTGFFDIAPASKTTATTMAPPPRKTIKKKKGDEKSKRSRSAAATTTHHRPTPPPPAASSRDDDDEDDGPPAEDVVGGRRARRNVRFAVECDGDGDGGGGALGREAKEEEEEGEERAAPKKRGFTSSERQDEKDEPRVVPKRGLTKSSSKMSWKSSRFVALMNDDGDSKNLTVQKRDPTEALPMDRSKRRKRAFLRRRHDSAVAVRGLFGGGGGGGGGGRGRAEEKEVCGRCRLYVKNVERRSSSSSSRRLGGSASRNLGSSSDEFEDEAAAAADDDDDDDWSEENIHCRCPPMPTHYVLSSNYKKKKRTVLDRFLHLFCLDRSKAIYTGYDSAIQRYMQWTFRSSFVALFLSQMILFLFGVVSFATFFYLAGKSEPACIQGGNYEDDAVGNGAAFLDAIALSWTTFSTVGYGHTYPSLSPQYTAEGLPPGRCAFVGVLSSMESFVGVLYAGFCGAIVFGKVLRIQSQAQVTFSEAIVVRYGDGVELYDSDEEDDCDDENDDYMFSDDDENDDEPLPPRSATAASLLLRPPSPPAENRRVPCPILEFRIINDGFGKEFGEILDASLTVIASFREESMLSPSTKRLRKSDATDASDAFDDSDYGSPDASSTVVPKRVLRQVDVEVREHPCFQSVWYARHVLDEDSPLLTPEARKRIRSRGDGSWPPDLNTARRMRESFCQFDELLVSLNGVSNLSTASVYAQKSYGIVDVVVGYQFARCMYRRERDGAVRVDRDVIDDVFEQFGGGGEPLLKED